MVVHGLALLAELLSGFANAEFPGGRYCGHLLEEALPADGEGELVTGQVSHGVQDVSNDALGKGLAGLGEWRVHPVADFLSGQGTARRRVSLKILLGHRNK